MDCSDVRSRLDAWIDGELAAAEAAAVAAHVGACAICAAYRESAREISGAFRRLPYSPAPSSLRRHILAASTRRQHVRTIVNRWGLVAAAVVFLATGAAGGAFVATRSRVDPIADQVVASHIRSLLVADHLTDVLSSDRHTVKPWFAGRLTFAPPVEDLSGVGFPLIGGRVDYVAGRPVAAVVYGRRNHRINVFIWPDEGNRSPRQDTMQGFHVLHWAAHGMAFWLVSDVSPDELQELARYLS